MTVRRESALGFGRERRVRRKSEFDATFQQGRRVTLPHFVLVFSARPEDASSRASRLGLVVSRKAGNAVVRNRIKRLCREAFRQAGDELPAAVDFLIIPRPGAATLAAHEVAGELRSGVLRAKKLLAKGPPLSHVPGALAPPKGRRETPS